MSFAQYAATGSLDDQEDFVEDVVKKTHGHKITLKQSLSMPGIKLSAYRMYFILVETPRG